MFFILAVSLADNLGCTRQPCDANLYTRLNAKQAGLAAVAQLDANGDGKLDTNELDKCPGLKIAFSRLDAAGRGYVTAEDISQRISQWQASRVGRVAITCIVLRNGTPLEGACIRFVPEAFLGRDMSIATGDTNKGGVAVLSTPSIGGLAAPGVPPGFYRVEITKVGVDIPARYNTHTTLGVEVAPDIDELRKPLEFDLRCPIRNPENG
jgi:hypothetical protein